jgi:hypothetical protein
MHHQPGSIGGVTVYIAKYQDTVGATQTGKPLPGVTVSVFNAGTQTPATLYNSDGSLLGSSAVSTDTDGLFSFYAVPGNYDLVASIGNFSKGFTSIVVGSNAIFDLDSDTPINGVVRIRHSTANFLNNSSLDSWLAGDNVAPDGWTLQGDVTISKSSTATMGGYAAQLVFGTANTGEFFQSIPCNAVADYTLTCYAQRISGTGNARMVAQEASGLYREIVSIPLPTDAPGYFRLAALTFRPLIDGSIRFNIRSADGTASTWLIDECMFQESKGLATAMQPKFLDDTYNQNVYGTLYFKKPPELQAGAIITGLNVYADNTAALAGGMTANNIYRTATGQIMVVY